MTRPFFLLRSACLSAGLFFAACLPARAEPLSVVVSLKPIHSLAAQVMDGIGEPDLIIEGAASAHTYQMRPSDAMALEEADLVVWIGPDMETFLQDPIRALAGSAESLSVIELDGIVLHGIREGGTFEVHSHDHGDDHDHGDHDHGHDAHEEHDHDHHRGDDHGTTDPHLWLDPSNAQLFVAALAERLAALDADNAAGYRANAGEAIERLADLDRRLAEQMAPLAGLPFIVFHDAYQYFERRYGLTAAGAITLDPGRTPGARRLTEIRDLISSESVRCVFAEPQFEPRFVRVIVEGTEARIGELDPLGADLAAGPEAYEELMRSLADDFAACLAQ